MADGDGAARQRDRLQRRALPRMREVHDHAEPVHLRDRLAAHAGDAAVLGLLPAAAEQRLVVVGELQEADAELMQDFDQADIVLDRHRRLQAEEDRRAVALRSARDIGGLTARQDEVGVIAEPLVPVGDQPRRLAKALVIGHRGVDGIETAGAHLLEDLARPAAILQSVDADGTLWAGRRHVGAPA